jgi:uncharacterized protein (DUF2235 family)
MGTEYKNIILLSDGTGNSSAKLFKTNVWRVYQALDLADPKDPEQPRQFAFYDNGVGSSSFKPLAALGGAVGVGLSRNVRDLYTFVCRTYQPGDKIYAFGFSRGAFTIRVLVGLILDQGLVPYDGNEAELDRYAAAAYRAYRKKYNTTGGLVGPLRQLRDFVIDTRDRLFGRRLYRQVVKIGRPQSPDALNIEFVGLWDTVDAYGLPVDEMTRAVDWFIWPLTMRDLNLNGRVKRARHALALDDERNTFHPRLWNEEPFAERPDTGVPGGNRATTHIDEERISQVWFAGVHSNVGGGYPDDSLAHVSLEWIMSEAKKYGVRFSTKIWDEFRAVADENGPIYDSRHGLGGYYRYNPRRIEKLTHTDEVVIKRPKVHESVLRRIQVGHDGYAPFVLPRDFAVVSIDGAIVDRAEYRETHVGKDFSKERENVWNWVWWRRLAYFSTLFTTFTLALMPLIWPALPKGACESKFCFVSDGIDFVAAILPGLSTTWTDSFSSHPDVFLVLASLIGFGLWVGGGLECTIHDAMRPIWYSIPNTRPRDISPFSGPARPGLMNRAVEWLRTRRLYQSTFWYVSNWVIPSLFLLLVGYTAIAIVSQVTFAIRVSWGDVCASTGTPKAVFAQEEAYPFTTNALCASTGLQLDKGATYRLRFTIPKSIPWTDNGIPAGPNGIRSEHVPITMTVGVPLRRYLSLPWFKPIARIGVSGTDEYPLDPKPSLAWNSDSRKPKTSGWLNWLNTCSGATAARGPSTADVIFESEIVARSSGELFLYVNDAVLHPALTTLFYCNNEGTAHVTVERVVPL